MKIKIETDFPDGDACNGCYFLVDKCFCRLVNQYLEEDTVEIRKNLWRLDVKKWHTCPSIGG